MIDKKNRHNCLLTDIYHFYLLNRDKITISSILGFTPKNLYLAAFVMLLLFATKSVSVVIYGGLLYAASGIMFSLPVAILVNTIGTVLMVSIPFFIGKNAGQDTMSKLVERNPKLEVLRDVPSKNELFISIFVRLIGMLPGDLVGMYLGASGIRYSKYITGSMIGLFPAIEPVNPNAEIMAKDTCYLTDEETA